MRRSLLILASIGTIMIFLLGTASGNTSAFHQYYTPLLILNALLLSGLSILVVLRLWRLQRRVQQKTFGSRLALRLVLMFALVAILPGAIVYTLSVQFLNRSVETWFDISVDNALDRGLNLGRAAIDYQLTDLVRKAKIIVWEVPSEGSSSSMVARLSSLREQFGVQELSIFDENGTVLAHINSVNASLIPRQPERSILRGLEREPYRQVETANDQTLIMRVLMPLPDTGFSNKRRILQLIQPVPERLAADAELVESVRGAYLQNSQSRQGLKRIFSLTLTIALLMALFGALALAIYLSDRLAGPLSLLAAGTRAVAQGDFSQQQPVTSRDELGILTHSFNRMTRQLADARAKLEEHQAEQAAARAYVETILGSLSAGVCSFDQSWQLRSCNQSALRILGVEEHMLAELPLPRWPEIYPSLAPFAEFSQLLHQNKGKRLQQQIVLGDAKRVILTRATTFAVTESEIGYLLVFDEVTDLLTAQRDAAWGEVARRLAHEIKNPLTPIQLAAERLELKLADSLDAPKAELLTRNTQTIVKQVAALKQMVDAFREYSRSASGSKKPLDFHELLTELLVLYETAPILREDDDELPAWVYGDATSLRQVVHNLLQNAQDAIRDTESKRILLRTAKQDGKLILTVEDSGPGFDPEVLGRVFEPYVTTKKKGTGLGLAIVKKIIEDHQGTILAGNKESTGAFIRVELPLWEENSG